ncbi:MAG: MBL fold metallo-hydrolase, partial [Vicinamibacteria bacterium]
ARGIFWERLGGPANWTTMAAKKAEFEALGGTFVEHATATEIYPGVWLTGPVPRTHPERNWGNPMSRGASGNQVRSPDGPVEDNIPESMSLVINTTKGLVVVSGCGHAGMINTLEYAQSVVQPAPIHAAIGGFHLLHGSDAHLAWTAEKLVDLELENFVGAHCTGIEPVYRFRELVGLGRANSVVGATGASFSLEAGIDPSTLAR